MCSGHQITVNLWGARATDFDISEVKELGKSEAVIVIFVGTLVKTYEGYYNCITQSVYMVYKYF
jgi:hypothetical protein